MSEDLLFAKIAEQTAKNFNDHFRDRMDEVERGHIEVFLKLWNLRPFDKTNGEITRITRLMASYKKVKEETKDQGDYKKLPEEIPEIPLIRRMLLGADYVAQSHRLRAFETNKRRMVKSPKRWSRAAIHAVCYAVESTRRRMNNAATPKPSRFEEEWTKLYLAPMVMRGKADLQEAALIVMTVKQE